MPPAAFVKIAARIPSLPKTRIGKITSRERVSLVKMHAALHRGDGNSPTLPITRRPACPIAVERGKCGIRSYGFRAASFSSSANAPSPEPSTSAIFGRNFVFERMNFAARSARANSPLPLLLRFCSGAHFSMIPAMDADIKFAIVPASIARIPSRANSSFLFGASAPMPPI